MRASAAAVVRHDAEDDPPTPGEASCPRPVQRVGRILSDRRLLAADLGAELYGRSLRGAGIVPSQVARHLEIDESTVRSWMTADRAKAITVRDVLAGPPSVCRVLGAQLVAVATPPPPARTQSEQVMDLVAKLGDLALAVRAGSDIAVERAVLAVEDSTAALRSLRARRMP